MPPPPPRRVLPGAGMMRPPQRPGMARAGAASRVGGGAAVGEKRKMQCIDFTEAVTLRVADDPKAASLAEAAPEPAMAAKRVQDRLRAEMLEKEREKCVAAHAHAHARSA
jgi:hypothetical protein